VTSNIVQAMWIGDRLGYMEQLSIASFLHHGHEVHLYLYGPCQGVPAGTTVKDGRDILPEGQIFHYPSGYGKGSPSAFSNLFRWALLFDRGGWWVDLDVVALRPFRFEGDYVLGPTNGSRGRPRLAAGVIHVPPRSRLMERCLEAARAADQETVLWGEIGPSLLARMARELGMEGVMQPPSVFYPIDAKDFWHFIRPGYSAGDAVAVHLWAQLWRDYGLNPASRYPDGSLYEQLLRRYLPEASAASRQRVNVVAAELRSIPTRVTTGAWFLWNRRYRPRLLRALGVLPVPRG